MATTSKKNQIKNVEKEINPTPKRTPSKRKKIPNSEDKASKKDEFQKKGISNFDEKTKKEDAVKKIAAHSQDEKFLFQTLHHLNENEFSESIRSNVINFEVNKARIDTEEKLQKSGKLTYLTEVEVNQILLKNQAENDINEKLIWVSFFAGLLTVCAYLHFMEIKSRIIPKKTFYGT